MGKDSFYGALATLQQTGCLRRMQVPRAGRYGEIYERVLTRAITNDSTNYTWVWQKLILELKPFPLSIYLFLLTYPTPVFIREIVERFDCNETTAQKWLTYLIHHKLVVGTSARDKGRITGYLYRAVELNQREVETWSLTAGIPTRKKQDGKLPDGKLPETSRPVGKKKVTYKGTSLHLNLPSTHNRPMNPSAASDDARSRRGAKNPKPTGSKPIAADGGARDWILTYEDKDPDLYELWSDSLFGDDYLSQGYHLSEQCLLFALDRATGGQISRALISKEGLDGFRCLVCATAVIAEVDPREALAYVIELITTRFADGKWIRLNSWGVIGPNLAREIRGAGDIPWHHRNGVPNYDPEVPF